MCLKVACKRHNKHKSRGMSQHFSNPNDSVIFIVLCSARGRVGGCSGTDFQIAVSGRLTTQGEQLSRLWPFQSNSTL